MQARSTKTFAENHLTMLALAIGLLAIAVTLAVVGTISSNSQSSAAEVVQPAAARLAVSIPSGIGFDIGHVNVKTERMNWGIGVGLDAGNIKATIVRQERGNGVGLDAAQVIATASGIDTVQQLPGLGVGFDPGFVSHQPAPQVHGLGTGLTEH